MRDLTVADHKNTGDLKMQDPTLPYQIAGVENTRHDDGVQCAATNARPDIN